MVCGSHGGGATLGLCASRCFRSRHDRHQDLWLTICIARDVIAVVPHLYARHNELGEVRVLDLGRRIGR